MTDSIDHTKQPWWNEVQQMRFLHIGSLLLVNSFIELAPERIAEWTTWLKDKYKNCKVVWV